MFNTCRAAVFALVALAGIAATVPARAESPFASWAAVVIAGDYQRRGQSIPGYDNARRDVAKALIAAGFDPARVRQFSSQPRWFPNETLEETDDDNVEDALEDLVERGATGCLFYLTSQGRKRGDVWFGGDTLSPRDLNGVLDACGDRPTVVIISACHSGAFIPDLAKPNRFVFASSRADRTSFGCGVETYPYFDACVLREMPKAASFTALARAVKECVAARERETNTRWQSEPQLSAGATVAPLLDSVSFPRRAAEP